MSDNNHFSESVTFTADGLDQVVEQTRQARQETDQLTAAQQRAAKVLAMRQQAQQRVNQTRVNQPPDYGRPINSRTAFGGQPMTVNANYGGTIAGAQRVNQPIRINAQSVQIVGSSFRDNGMSQDRINQRQHRERVNGGGLSLGSAGLAAGAAGVLAKSVADAGKRIEKFAINQKGPEAKKVNALRMLVDMNQPPPVAPPPDPYVTRAERRKQAVEEDRERRRQSQQDTIHAYQTIMRTPAIHAERDYQQSAMGAIDETGVLDYATKLNKSLGELTNDQLKDMARQLNLPGRSGDRSKAGLTNFLAGQMANRMTDVPAEKKRSPSGLREQFAEEDARRQYANEMKQLTSTSAMLRRNYDAARAGLDQFGKSAKAWATSPEMKARLGGAQAWAGSKWEKYGDQAKSRAGYAALGVAGTAVGMGWAGLQQTVTGQRFNNEIQRLQLELANVFGPALRKATEYLGGFTNSLGRMNRREQQLLSAAALGVTGYGALRAAGMGGLVTRPLGAALQVGALGAQYGYAGAQRLGQATGTSMLAMGAAGAVAIGGAVTAINRNEARNDVADQVKRLNQGRLDVEEEADLARRAKLAIQRTGGEKEFLNQAEQNRQEAARRLDGLDPNGKDLGAWGKAKANFNDLRRNLDFGIGIGGDLKQIERKAMEDAPVVAFLKAKKEGRDVGGGNRNQEVLAGGGFEGFLDTYRRTEEAVGKIDAGPPAGGGGDEMLAVMKAMAAAVQALNERQAAGDKKADAVEPPKLQKNH